MSKKDTSEEPLVETNVSVVNKLVREISFFFTLAVALFLALALFSYHRGDLSWHPAYEHPMIHNAAGRVGAFLASYLLLAFGFVGYLLPVLVAYWGFLAWHQAWQRAEAIRWGILTARFIAMLVSMVLLAVLIEFYQPLASLATSYYPGGLVGYSIAHALVGVFNVPGSLVIILFTFLISVSLFSGLSWFYLFQSVGVFVWSFIFGVGKKLKSMNMKPALLAPFKVLKRCIVSMKQRFSKQDITTNDVSIGQVRSPVTTVAPTRQASLNAESNEQDTTKMSITQKIRSFSKIGKPELLDQVELSLDEPLIKCGKVSKKIKVGALPMLTLLDTPVHRMDQVPTAEQLHHQACSVEERLADFGIQAQVVSQYPGPVVTRFELQLAAGTKVSKITSLAKDLARSLSVISVRVVEVIPGKSCIGLELPNPSRAMVYFQEVVASSAYVQNRSPLALGLGKNIAGEPVVVDLAKMPHLLVAGTTGSGKSVCLNALLLSLLYKLTPRDLRMILIDPKMLELAVYEGVPHLLTPVVTDMKDAACALRWCVAEMERRYRMMASVGVRNLDGYNAKIAQAEKDKQPIIDKTIETGDGEPAVYLEHLPRIVVLADEFADMMVVVGKKVETLIARLAQKARAAGIHLILATQRPSVDVITGLIKANIPTRIAFQVSSKIDSRTIIDQQGAEQLLGHGDMLYLPPGSGVPMRVHGAYVSDDEVHRVVEYLKQTADTNYEDDIFNQSLTSGDAVVDGLFQDEKNAENDEYYDQAVEMVVQSRRVSISSIQRRFRIGYNRAATIVEAMEAAGVVSSMESNGAREVLAPSRNGD